MMETSLFSAEGISLSAPFDDGYEPWLALCRVKGLGCVSFKKLATELSDPTQAFCASRSALESIEELRNDTIDDLMHFDRWADVKRELNRIRAAGIGLIRYNDADYPARLRAIADPPPLLYVKGELKRVDDKSVAMVGSRAASEYGGRVARALARELSRAGFTVVSGLARGIDGIAHEAALNSGGRTIAVLGSGVERAYPPEHGQLYQRVSSNGAVVSELPMGTRPLAFNFPARNRLISGLSLGVVVVEATEKSGSLITASLALEQGREVFAVPGDIGSSRSRGAHRLIRQGAKLVETVDDILEEIAPQLLTRRGAALAAPLALPQNANAEARKIFALLQDASLPVDEVIEKSGLVAPRVLQILLELELQGYVRQLPGKRYAAEQAQ